MSFRIRVILFRLIYTALFLMHFILRVKNGQTYYNLHLDKYHIYLKHQIRLRIRLIV